MDSDEELYLKMCAGGQKAFDLLYERHKSGLYSILFSYLKNRQEAEELFQETFIKVLNERRVDFSGGSFRGWLYTIARNAALNRLRSRQRLASVQLDLEKRGNSAEDARPCPEEKYCQLELNKQISAISKKLPGQLAQVLELKLQGEDHRSIAHSLQIPLGTVKSRVHSIVQFFKRELNL